MHRQTFFVESNVIGRIAIVQLANGGGVMALFNQAMPPRRHFAMIGFAVVPDADVMDVLAGGQAGA